MLALGGRGQRMRERLLVGELRSKDYVCCCNHLLLIIFQPPVNGRDGATISNAQFPIDLRQRLLAVVTTALGSRQHAHIYPLALFCLSTSLVC